MHRIQRGLFLMLLFRTCLTIESLSGHIADTVDSNSVCINTLRLAGICVYGLEISTHSFEPQITPTQNHNRLSVLPTSSLHKYCNPSDSPEVHKVTFVLDQPSTLAWYIQKNEETIDLYKNIDILPSSLLIFESFLNLFCAYTSVSYTDDYHQYILTAFAAQRMQDVPTLLKSRQQYQYVFHETEQPEYIEQIFTNQAMAAAKKVCADKKGRDTSTCSHKPQLKVDRAEDGTCFLYLKTGYRQWNYRLCPDKLSKGLFEDITNWYPLIAEQHFQMRVEQSISKDLKDQQSRMSASRKEGSDARRDNVVSSTVSGIDTGSSGRVSNGQQHSQKKQKSAKLSRRQEEDVRPIVE